MFRSIERLEPRTLLASISPGFTETTIDGLNSPTSMALAPDGRIFVGEQGGALRVIENGQLLSTPFVTVPTTDEGERGLLGVAVDPNFATNHFIYLYYTDTAPIVRNIIVRFDASQNVAQAPEEIIFELDPLINVPNHNGGALAFATDGTLFVGVGENTVVANSQTLGNVLGKVLRIHTDGSIPSSNPFFNDPNVTGKNKAIYSYGLRNPFSLAVQPGTGRLFINDVGGNFFEEINEGLPAVNYGWPSEEGTEENPQFASPILSYDHGPECAITGGAFYNPSDSTFPSEFVGDYFFTDLCGGWVRSLDTTTLEVKDLATGLQGSTALAVGNDGAVYYLARGGGANDSGVLGRIQVSQLPVITDAPDTQTIPLGYPVTFSVDTSSDSPVTYQWLRNGVAIDGATASSLTIDSVARTDRNARFTVAVTNSAGTTTSEPAILRVTGNARPVVRNFVASDKPRFIAGQPFTFSATAIDPGFGDLDASAFTWKVDLHENRQVTPAFAETSGITTGTFTVPTQISSRAFYRVQLIVTDPGGAVRTVAKNVAPLIGRDVLRVGTPGIGMSYDGVTIRKTSTFRSVVGSTHTISALSDITLQNHPWAFDAWSDGGAFSHAITTAATPTIYTATYRPSDITFGAGSGLLATYFNNSDFTDVVTSRNDKSIHEFFSGAPLAGVDPASFSIRWEGEIEVPYSARWTFFTLSDDGVRLTINGQPVINRLNARGFGQARAAVDLEAGQRYSISLEYVQAGAGGQVRFLWQAPGTPTHVVPSTQLFS